MDKKEVYVDKDAAECFKALCGENGIAFIECTQHNTRLTKFVVEDKNNLIGVKMGGMKNEKQN